MAIVLCFLFLLDASYECNLRANLMKVDFEESPRTLQDVLRLNRKFYFPRGAALAHLLKTSPLEYHREVYQRAERKSVFPICSRRLSTESKRENY
jgi:hypothetical protein